MISFLRSSSAALVLLLLAALPLFGQALSGEPARVLVLGTYHFANPGRDVVKTEIADVLSIIGGGHAPILRELIGYDPRLRRVEAVDYLRP